MENFFKISFLCSRFSSFDNTPSTPVYSCVSSAQHLKTVLQQQQAIRHTSSTKNLLSINLLNYFFANSSYNKYISIIDKVNLYNVNANEIAYFILSLIVSLSWIVWRETKIYVF
jgi:hypothetical protein